MSAALPVQELVDRAVLTLRGLPDARYHHGLASRLYLLDLDDVRALRATWELRVELRRAVQEHVTTRGAADILVAIALLDVLDDIAFVLLTVEQVLGYATGASPARGSGAWPLAKTG